MKGSDGARPGFRELTRRDFLSVGGGALAGASALGLAACGGQGSSGKTQLTFFSWNIPSDLQSFRHLIKEYEAKNSDVSINLQVVPEGDFNEWFQTRLAAGKAPDIQRMTWQQIGLYSSQDTLVDFSPYVDEGYGEAFEPVFWQAVDYEGKPYALPHHTDTFGVYYNTDYFDKLGFDKFPGSPKQGWSWDEFVSLARRVKDETDAKYAFAYGFQGPGTGYRWLPILYMHGGKLLSDDFKSPEIDSPAGVEAIAWTQQWFTEDLIPPSSSIKQTQSTTVADLFATGTVGMMLHGDWMMPYLKDNMKDFGWDATYMIRDKGMASDLGGNALAITKDSQDPEAAADFIKFVVDKQNMEYFVKNSQFIPARKILVESGIDYTYRPDTMNRFVEQSRTVPSEMAKVETFGSFNQINQKVEDQLDLAFTSDQSPEDTAKNIASGIRSVLNG
jgi:multiple sugar transport system substrate-binding protein